MKTLLLIPVILYTWLSLTYGDKIYHQIPNPTQQTKIHILNPTRPTDNPIRNCNPKIHLTNNQIKPSMNI